MSRTDAILQRLLMLHPNKLIDLSLDRMHRLLADLGHPEQRLPKTIHIAGTNGKGSTAAHLRAMLEAAGKRVHVYTSPHLVNFNERIRLGGKLVGNRQLNKALERCEKANGGKPITYFEITTAAAFVLFAEEPADYLLLEVGLGGRCDATNVIDNPLGTIVTPVSIDHVEFLGEGIKKIAGEKAGILKRGAPAVFARQTDEGLDVLEAKAAALGVTPFVSGRDFDGYAQNDRLIYQDEDGLLDLPPSKLAGPFQFDNATTAIAAVRHFKLPVTDAEIAKGLETVYWPARMMPLKTGKLRKFLPDGHELWLDGAHNEAGGGVVADAVNALNARNPRPLVLIMGTFANKDAKGFLAHFGDAPEIVLTVRIPGERASWSARELSDFAQAQGLPARPMRSVTGALKEAAKIKNARVVIAGGIYLAGRVLADNGTPPK